MNQEIDQEQNRLTNELEDSDEFERDTRFNTFKHSMMLQDKILKTFENLSESQSLDRDLEADAMDILQDESPEVYNNNRNLQ